MAKLNIIYRVKYYEDDYYSGKTYQTISFESKTATISIAPNETRKSKDLVDSTIKDLKNRTYFDKDETVETDDFEKKIMKYEIDQNERVSNNVHNILKELYPKLEEGAITTVDEAIKYLKEEMNIQ